MTKIKAVVFTLLCTIGLLGMPRAGGAEGLPEARTYGTASEVIHTLQAFAFGGFGAQDYTRFDSNGSGSRFCTAPCLYEAALFLPAGALLVSLELDACDTDSSPNILLTVFRVGKLENPPFEQLATTE